MRHDHDAAAAAAAVADDVRSALLTDLLGQVAGCFLRRETRQTCGHMVRGLLMELEDYDCQTIAEAAGHRGPYRLQHFLSWRSGTSSRFWPSRQCGRPFTLMTGILMTGMRC